MSDVTQLLVRIESGDSKAASDLFPLVYDELRRLANWQMSSEKPGQTLQATALVHEAYVKLVGSSNPVNYSGKKGFFSAASEAMRHILVDVARQKMAQKRGGDVARQDIELANVPIEKPSEMLAVHEALNALTQHDSQAADVVVMHYFGGFSIAEIAELQGVSRATLNRKWTYARIWLRDYIVNAD
jgi:RNA polymerase sigma factor (TIGR02999 family)